MNSEPGSQATLQSFFDKDHGDLKSDQSGSASRGERAPLFTGDLSFHCRRAILKIAVQNPQDPFKSL
jgi:hypothetical protein